VIATENYYITDQGEQRSQAIGMTSNVLLLLVVFVDRTEDGAEIIHIVSARKVVDYEQSAYEDQFR
jgi:uncharacterized DUF497 family protein